jgi:hypothetical protein
VRYYDIKITKKGGTLFVPPSMKALGMRNTSYTSYVRGNNVTSALDIELDLPVLTADEPQGGIVQIFGVGLEDLAQVNNLSEATIEIRGGMKKGLPLAVPHAPDLLVRGTIIKCFGNWQGVNTVLALIIEPLVDDADKPPNLALNVPDGQTLSQGLKAVLQTAYPDYTITVSISDELKVKGQQSGYYGTLTQLSLAVKQFTKDKQFRGIKRLDGTPYRGVSVTIGDKTITVSDGTQQSSTAGTTQDNPREIQFYEIIGQPTWIDPLIINFKTVLRGDLKVDDYIKLPKTLATPYVLTGTGAVSALEQNDPLPSQNNLVFQGVFQILGLHHFGHFRQADGDSWATSIDAVPLDQNAPATEPVSTGTTTASGSSKITSQPLPPPPQAPTPADEPFA